MKSNVVFRPTVIIGLGGTGYGAVLKLKKHFRDAYGSIPQIIRFLTFDTTENVEHTELDRDGLPVTLEPHTEQYVIQVANPAGLLSNGNEQIESWWPRNIPMKAIIAGAGQVRARGRLALFDKCEEIISAIRKAVDDVALIKSRREMYKDDFLVSERGGIEIYIVTSLAGGTGSGMFLDTAFITRSFLDSKSNITGVFVLPGIFSGKAGVPLVKANAFGALKELEHFANLGLDNGFSIQYNTAHLVEARQPPFDLIYLIDNTNESGHGIREMAELQATIAQGVYLQIGAQIGTNQENTVDNIKTQLSTAGRVRDRSASYCSFGVGTLTLPVRQYEASEVNAARCLLEEGLLAHKVAEEKVDGEVVQFILDNKLRNGDSDELINALVEQENGAPMRFSMPLGQLARYDGTAPTLIKNLHATYRGRVEQQVAQQIGGNYKRLVSSSVSAVEDWCEAKLNLPNGSSHVARFLQKFASTLESYQQTMETEAHEEGARLAALSFQTAEEEIRKATSVWGSSRREKQVKAGCENYRGLVNRECAIFIEKMSREKAAELYGELRTVVNELAKQCEDLRQRLTGALKLLNQLYANLTTRHGVENPFEYTLKFDAQQNCPDLSPIDFVRWHQEKSTSLSSWLAVRDEDVARELRDFVREKYPLTQQTIDEVLRNTDTESVGRALNQLDHLSVPLWHYNDSKIPINNRNIITELYHYGVADADDTALRDLKITNHVPRGTTEPSFVSTTEAQRIMLFKVRVGVPLFALYDIDAMERAYNDPDKNISNHLHHDWESFPSLIPRINDDRALRWFALAQAPSPFGLISNHGRSYYMKSKNGRSSGNGEVELGQGRVEAYKKFEKDREMINQVQQTVSTALRTDGKDKVVEVLNHHVDQLITQLSPIEQPLVKEQVKREVEELEKYIKELQTIN